MKNHFTVLRNLIALFVIAGIISSCGKDDDPGSNLTGIVAFGIQGYDVDFTLDQSALTIGNIGADSLPFGTDLTAIVAEFDKIALTTVTVNGVPQVSGVTANDFTNPLVYKVVAEDGTTTRNYTVSVNASQVDPETVSWNRIANEEWSAFQHTRAATIGGKLWVYGSNNAATSMGAYSSSDGGITWTMEEAKDDEFNYSTEEEGFPFPYGRGMALVNFDNKLWSIAGWLKGRPTETGIGFDDPTPDIWSSSDGLNWSRHVNEESFSKREAVSALAFDSKLWMIGGNGAGLFGAVGNPLNDVWSSTNGTTWTQATAAATFDARTAPAAVVFDDKMWIIAGHNNANGLLNDVWSSTDGITWTQATAEAAFSPRRGAAVFVFNDKLFLVGGQGVENEATVQYNDMWVSEDGITWIAVDPTDPFALPGGFTGRSNHAVVVDDNEIFIIGGTGPVVEVSTYYSDVWRGAGVE